MDLHVQVWLMALYGVIFGVCFGLALWYHRRGYPDEQHTHAGPRQPDAEATALDALLTMRAIVHQLANNVHELALQFDFALNTQDAREQQEVRDQLRTSLHRFTEISHQVAQIDGTLAGIAKSHASSRGHIH